MTDCRDLDLPTGCPDLCPQSKSSPYLTKHTSWQHSNGLNQTPESLTPVRHLLHRLRALHPYVVLAQARSRPMNSGRASRRAERFIMSGPVSPDESAALGRARRRCIQAEDFAFPLRPPKTAARSSTTSL